VFNLLWGCGVLAVGLTIFWIADTLAGVASTVSHTLFSGTTRRTWYRSYRVGGLVFAAVGLVFLVVSLMELV